MTFFAAAGYNIIFTIRAHFSDGRLFGDIEKRLLLLRALRSAAHARR